MNTKKNKDKMTFSHKEEDTNKDNSQEKLQDNDNLSEEDNLQNNPIDELQEKYNDLNNTYLRLYADFENYRKRTIKEKADIIKFGCEKVILSIISLIDDFDRAISSIKKTNNKDTAVEGLDLIYSKFKNILQQNGVTEVETIGQTFDPERFEAITTIPVEDKSMSGKIIDCIEKGYEINDKVIRFPKVIVGE